MSMRLMSESIARASSALFLLLLTAGCGGDGSQGKGAMGDAHAAGLSGVWEVTFRLERPLSLGMDAKRLPRNVSGTVALIEDLDGPHSFEQIDKPTHVGVYNVDMDSLGFPPRDNGIIPSVAARIVLGALKSSSGSHDSVYMVFNPETPRHALRLTGTFNGTDGSGEWIAESFLGGGGTFIIRRR